MNAKTARSALNHALAVHASVPGPGYSSRPYQERWRKGLAEARDAYHVAADAYEELGQEAIARRIRIRIRQIERVIGRRMKIYQQERARGEPATSAYKKAMDQSWFVVLSTIGDDPSELAVGESSGYLTRGIVSPKNAIDLDWIERHGKDRYRVYDVDLAIENLPDWLRGDNLRALADTTSVTPLAFRKMWRSPRVHERAYARIDVGQFFGFENLDSYPQEYTRKQMELRYQRRFAK